MSHDKKSGADHFSGKPEDAANLVRAVESGEAQRRIAALENSIGNLEKSLLERHARLITIIFTAVSVVVGLSSLSVVILGWSSRTENREATQAMKQDVKDKLEEIEKRFQILAGESSKKPHIETSTPKGLLEGQIFEVSSMQQLPIYPVFLKNDGDKRSDPLSIRLYCSSDFHINSADWQGIESSEKEYPVSYYLTIESRTMGIGVAPKETWTISSAYGGQVWGSVTNIINCKLLVFYGGESPAESKFIIKLK